MSGHISYLYDTRPDARAILTVLVPETLDILNQVWVIHMFDLSLEVTYDPD